VVLDPVLL